MADSAMPYMGSNGEAAMPKWPAAVAAYGEGCHPVSLPARLAPTRASNCLPGQCDTDLAGQAPKLGPSGLSPKGTAKEAWVINKGYTYNSASVRSPWILALSSISISRLRSSLSFSGFFPPSPPFVCT